MGKKNGWVVRKATAGNWLGEKTTRASDGRQRLQKNQPDYLDQEKEQPQQRGDRTRAKEHGGHSSRKKKGIEGGTPDGEQKRGPCRNEPVRSAQTRSSASECGVRPEAKERGEPTRNECEKTRGHARESTALGGTAAETRSRSLDGLY